MLNTPLAKVAVFPETAVPLRDVNTPVVKVAVTPVANDVKFPVAAVTVPTWKVLPVTIFALIVPLTVALF